MDMFPGGKPPLEDFISSWYPILFAITCGFIFGFRSYMKGCPNPSTEKMEGKTVIVTGANTGIGKQIALDMALRGAKVILACRDIEKGKAAADEIKEATNGKNEEIHVKKLDLSTLKSVQDFVQHFKEDNKKLHLLVNNAGVIGHPQEKTPDGNDYSFQVNYLGHFALTHMLLDCLKATESSRIINISCHAYRIANFDFNDLNMEKVETYKPGEMYAQSKAAMVMFTRQMAKYLEGTNVCCNVINPGIVRSELYRNMPLMNNGFLYYSLLPIMWLFLKPSKDGAQTAMYCCVAKEEEGVSGKLYSECKIKDFEAAALEDEAIKQLWYLSFPLAGLKPSKAIEAETE